METLETLGSEMTAASKLSGLWLLSGCFDINPWARLLINTGTTPNIIRVRLIIAFHFIEIYVCKPNCIAVDNDCQNLSVANTSGVYKYKNYIFIMCHI